MAADARPVWFTELIAQQIAELGTQTALARRVAVSQQTVSNWAKGKTLPQPPEAVRLAIHLGEDPVVFAGRLWPELDQADRLATLRRLLADASDRDVEMVTTYAAEVVGRYTEISPARASPR